MIFLLGFLAAGLLALAVAPAIWRRAERLSIRRLEMLMPLSPREVVAERDALRADFAIEARRLEQVAEGHHARLAAAQAELGRAHVTGSDLQTRLFARDAQYVEQAHALTAAQRDLATAEAIQSAMMKALHDAEALARERFELLADRDRDLAALDELAEERRASLSAAEARIAGLDAHLESAARAQDVLRRDLQDKADEARRLAERDAGAPADSAEELAASTKALRLRAEATAHALSDMRTELDGLRASGAGVLGEIADLDDPRLREAIHDIGATIARLCVAEDASAARALEETPAA